MSFSKVLEEAMQKQAELQSEGNNGNEYSKANNLKPIYIMENQVENQEQVITEEQYQNALAIVDAFEQQYKIPAPTPEPTPENENFISVKVLLKNNDTTIVKDFGEDKLAILNEEGKEVALTRAEFDDLLSQGHLQIIE